MSVEYGDLLSNLEKIHTTELGVERIRRNLGLKTGDVVEWCRMRIVDENNKISRHGKNWYVVAETCTITVNATSFTIITAHKHNNKTRPVYLSPKDNL